MIFANLLNLCLLMIINYVVILLDRCYIAIFNCLCLFFSKFDKNVIISR